MRVRFYMPLAAAILLTAPSVSMSQPFNIGHRGTGTNVAGNPYPENTIVSFRKALQEGAHGVELDVMLAKDNGDPDPYNELVVMHDESLSRTTDCDGSPATPLCVEQMTLNEIRACTPVNAAGETFHQGGPNNFKVQTIPTLEESLDAIFDHTPGAIVNIEIKSQPPTDEDSILERCSSADPEHRSTQLVVELLKEKYSPILDQIIISSFDPTAVALVEQLDSELKTAYLSIPANNVPGAPPFPAALNGVAVAAALGLDGLHPNNRDTTAEVVTLAGGFGLLVRPWTVNDCNEMKRLIALGVDAIITDEPEKVKKVFIQPQKTCVQLGF